MPVVGTAGHVDHGKSTLVARITGRDPDRWEEEKRRGLTIDLGFAWATLPDGTEVSFVDVPGHERYLKNMLAGIESIDVALFVVAADEGWMPQSEEHLAVLDLLGVDHGVVALTKVDTVDSELTELATAEVIERLRATSLEGAEVFPVSAISGEGIPELLEGLAENMPPHTSPSGRPRLWVDRSFSVAGAGTIVTGTLLDGGLRRDATVEIYPRGLRARIRSIETHERSTIEVVPGRRVALNLGGIDQHDVARGDMIGLPGQWDTSSRFAASIATARFVDELDQRGAYQIHIGSSSQRVTITGMTAAEAILALETPLPLTVGDRFILRDTGRKLVVAGGRVLDPAPGRTRKALEKASLVDPAGSPDAVATSLLSIRGSDSLQRLEVQSGGGSPAGAVAIGRFAILTSALEHLTEKAIALVDAEHRTHPLRPGIPLATLAARLGVDATVAEAAIDRSTDLERIGPDVARKGREAALSDDQEEAWQRVVSRLGQSLAVPRESDLGIDAELIALKIRSGDLVRVAPGLLYLPDQIAQLEAIMRAFDGEFTVADFRDAADLSRKYAVPFLEWSDREGLTVRRGDIRRSR